MKTPKKVFIKDIIDINILIYEMYEKNQVIYFLFKKKHLSDEVFICSIRNRGVKDQCIPICNVLKNTPLSSITKSLDKIEVYYPKYKRTKQFTIVDKYLCGKLVKAPYYIYGRYIGTMPHFEFIGSKNIYPDNTCVVFNQ